MPVWLQMTRNYSNPESVNYKLAYLREQIGDMDFGDLAYEDQVQLAMLGETVIVGGFLRTELLKAKSISAEKLSVDDLTAISGHFSSLTAGSAGGHARLHLGQFSSEPFLHMYDNNDILRVQLQKDRINFFDDNGNLGGFLRSIYNSGSDRSVLHIQAGTRSMELYSSISGDHSVLRPDKASSGFIGDNVRPFHSMNADYFIQTSGLEAKENIDKCDLQACYDAVKQLQFKTYTQKSQNLRLGIIAEDAPDTLTSAADGKGIDLYAYISMIGAALQHLINMVEGGHEEPTDQPE